MVVSNEAPRSSAARYQAEFFRSQPHFAPSELRGVFSSPSSPQQAAGYSAKENKTDEEIAVLVQMGDVESFGLLVERYGLRMLRYGRKFLADTEDIKDFVQEVFIKSYVSIKSFNAKRKFSPWLYRIAHNEFINATKKKSRLPILFFDLDVLWPQFQSELAADDEVSRQEIKDMLDNCLGKLDVKYKEPLILYFFEDMSYQEIGEVLRIPIATVGIRLRRGKAKLKKLFEQNDQNKKHV